MMSRRRGAPLLAAGAVLFSLGFAAIAGAVPLKLPGFPIAAGGAIKEAVALADMDHDGVPEIIAVAGNKLLIETSRGVPFGHFPVDLAALVGKADVILVGPPAVGDLDGDGKPDVALALSLGADEDGVLIAIRNDGRPLWLKPITLPKGPGGGCTIAELNGSAAVLVGTRSGALHAVLASGADAPGFPVKLKSPLSSGVAVGRFTTDQKPVIAVGAGDGKVFVLTAAGKPVPGFPLVTGYEVSGMPVFGDVDDDGQAELVVASQDFKIYAVKSDGASAPGFPVSTGYRIYGGPALGDLDHDGRLDVVVGSGDGKVYAWTGTGRAVKGFPVSVGTRLHSNVVVADASRTGRDEVFAVSADGNLFGFAGDGRKLDGYPIHVGNDVNATPVLGDMDLDPAVELIVGNAEGELQGFKLERTGDLPQTPLSWPAPGHDATRQSHYGPYAPRYSKVVVAPKVAHAGETVELTYQFSNIDGTPEPDTRIRWTLDGQPVPDLDQKKAVPGDRVKKGQRWRATVESPDDYALFKDGPLATRITSTEVRVVDTVPTACKVVVEPNPARMTDILTARVVTPSTDADGDAITYHFLWQRNGHVGPLVQTVPAGSARKGEHWRVLVTPSDGEKDGSTTDAEVVIQDTPPSAPVIAIGPANPTTETEIKVTILKDATDADGDKLTYRSAFTINGERQALGPGRLTLPPGMARKGDLVKAEVWASDGELEGPPVSAEIHVVNAAPEQPKVAIAPTTPHAGDTLSSGLVAAARDPDRDPVKYRVAWTKNGQPAGGPGMLVVAATEVHKGDTWAVTYQPNDGQLDGPSGAALVKVLNSPPTQPRITVSDPTPAVTETVKVDLAEPARDPDGDAVHYEYKWDVQGAPASGGSSGALAQLATGSGDKAQLLPGEFRKHQRITVQVTPVDSDGARGPSSTAEIRPRNTPPTSPKIDIEPKTATIETGLRSVLVAPSTDADGDSITYHYKWFRDGVEVTDIGDHDSVKPGVAKHGETWRLQVTPSDGESDGPPVDASIVIQNVPPLAPFVTISPDHPTIVSGLTCKILQPAKDADGDQLTLHYRWLRDGELYAVPSDSASAPVGAMRAGQTWKCEVFASDEWSSSPVASASASVVNAPPSAPKVAVEPKVAKAGDALTCAIEEAAIDPEGDPVHYSFRWQPPKGVKLPALQDPARLPPGLVKKGQTWSCDVTASDGKIASDAVVAELAVGNTPPTPPELSVEPWGARPGQDLTCNLVRPAADVDGDPIKYAYAWSKNGTVQSFATSSGSVPGRLVKAGDRWSCTATPNDGANDGQPASSADVTVAGGSDESE